MTRAEAKRRCCLAFAKHMDNGSENAWLREGADGAELSPAAARRMREAFDELIRELRRRGEPPADRTKTQQGAASR